jgi:hypothetical protein
MLLLTENNTFNTLRLANWPRQQPKIEPRTDALTEKKAFEPNIELRTDALMEKKAFEPYTGAAGQACAWPQQTATHFPKHFPI